MPPVGRCAGQRAAGGGPRQAYLMLPLGRWAPTTSVGERAPFSAYLLP